MNAKQVEIIESNLWQRIHNYAELHCDIHVQEELNEIAAGLNES